MKKRLGLLLLVTLATLSACPAQEKTGAITIGMDSEEAREKLGGLDGSCVFDGLRWIVSDLPGIDRLEMTFVKGEKDCFKVTAINESAAPRQKPFVAPAHPADPKVVNAVLQGSACVSQDAAEEIFRLEAMQMLMRQQYDQLEQLLLAHHSWPGARSPDHSFVAVLDDEQSYNEPLGYHEGAAIIARHFENWYRARPQSRFARVAWAHASAYEAGAIWDGKGLSRYSQQGIDQDVLWEGAKPLSRRRAGEAPWDLSDTLEDLDMGAEANHPPELSKADKIFLDTITSNPQSTVAYWRILKFYAHRSDPRGLAILAAKLSPACAARLYSQLLRRDDREQWLPAMRPWDELKGPLKELVGQEPQSAFWRNVYAFGAMSHHDDEAARRSLQEIGDQMDLGVWKSYRAYSQACEKVGVTPLSSKAQVSPNLWSFDQNASAFPLPTNSGFPLQIQIFDLLRRQQFAELEAIASEMRKSGQGTVDFYRALSGFHLGDRNQFETTLADLLRWSIAYPKNSTARVALALFYERFAWRARGQGYANTITPIGAGMMRRRAAEASLNLHAAEQLGNRDEAFHEGKLVLVQLGLGDLSQVLNDTQDSLTAEPGHLDVIETLTTLLLPRWFGGQTGVQVAARRLTEKNKSTLGDGIYFALATCLNYYEHKAYNDPGNPCYIAWDRVVAGFEDLRKRRVEIPLHMLESYALLTVLNQDRAQARLAFDLLGDRWGRTSYRSYWGTPLSIQRVRDWADGKGPWPDDETHFKVKGVGWEETKRYHAGRQIPGRAGVALKIDWDTPLQSAHINSFNFILHHPPMKAPDGEILNEHSAEVTLFPGDKLLPYTFDIKEGYEVVPGPWYLEVLDMSDDNKKLITVPLEVKAES